MTQQNRKREHKRIIARYEANKAWEAKLKRWENAKCAYCGQGFRDDYGFIELGFEDLEDHNWFAHRSCYEKEHPDAILMATVSEAVKWQ